MIELSIVSGTYNRINWMKAMVESVRYSIGVGIPYEIVLVDGGSTDGTQEWCKSQSDIVLIEQKTLLGAVKAFNAGAYAARGRYVILANDDITFIDKSIMAALSFMQDNPMVGIGCFYQDRGGKDFHVEEMPAIENSVQISTYYGQVCIVQKWLGDKVGWWGDYLHTYGGDNELSCNVIELGYKIEPVPCAAIHDSTPMDELRKVNNEKMAKVGGQHPDTAKWLAKWTRNGKTGPVIRDNPGALETLPRKVRVFYSPIYEPGHTIQRLTKHGLRDALAKVSLVVELAYTDTTEDDILYTACMHDADVFLLQMHSGSTLNLVERLRHQHPQAIFVNWNGDYHPENLYAHDYLQMLKLFDHVGVVTTEVARIYDTHAINWFYWQIGYEVAAPAKRAAKHDVLFMANGYSRERIELATKLRALKGVNVGIYGSWSTNIAPNGNTLYDFAAGEALYRGCKIALGDSQWPNATGFVSNRLFQAMAAGAFMLHQYFDGMEELLGLVNGVHIVTWVSWVDLVEKINYYLRNPDERNKIAIAGQKFVLQNHSFDRRVEELFARINARR